MVAIAELVTEKVVGFLAGGYQDTEQARTGYEPARDARGRLLPGWSGNPAGRPRGRSARALTWQWRDRQRDPGPTPRTAATQAPGLARNRAQNTWVGEQSRVSADCGQIVARGRAIIVNGAA